MKAQARACAVDSERLITRGFCGIGMREKTADCLDVYYSMIRYDKVR